VNEAAPPLVGIRAGLPLQLDDLLATIWLPARCGTWSRGIGDPTKLPWALEQCIARLPPGGLWRAYGDGARAWLVTARPVQAASPDPSAIALELHFFENDGAACAAGIWQRSTDTDWSLNSVLDGYRLSTGVEQMAQSSS
jgi:hypothetical protein